MYSNATTSTLNITGATAAMNGYKYQVVVSSGSCNSTSVAATLVVNSVPAQPSTISGVLSFARERHKPIQSLMFLASLTPGIRRQVGH